MIKRRSQKKARLPRCIMCNKPLAPLHEYRSVRVDSPEGYSTRYEKGAIIGYGYLGEGFFCSLRHGWRYGLVWAKSRAVEE